MALSRASNQIISAGGEPRSCCQPVLTPPSFSAGLTFNVNYPAGVAGDRGPGLGRHQRTECLAAISFRWAAYRVTRRGGPRCSGGDPRLAKKFYSPSSPFRLDLWEARDLPRSSDRSRGSHRAFSLRVTRKLPREQHRELTVFPAAMHHADAA
jgi:hypothetical protein